jgi:hypothetical protein
MQTITRNKSNKLKLAAASAAATLALHGAPATRYKASIARLEAQLRASDDPGEQFALQDQILFVCRMARAEHGIDLGGSPMKSDDIVRYWRELAHKEPTFGFGALRAEALAECRWMATAEARDYPGNLNRLDQWRQLAQRPDVPPAIQELFEAAGLLPA